MASTGQDLGVRTERPPAVGASPERRNLLPTTAPPMNRWTLRFPPEVETEFADANYPKVRAAQRALCWFIAAAYAIYALFLDAATAGEQLAAVRQMRALAIVVQLLIGAFTFHPAHRRHLLLPMALTMAAFVGFLIARAQVVGTTDTYIAGFVNMILAFFAAHVVFRVGFVQATVLALAGDAVWTVAAFAGGVLTPALASQLAFSTQVALAFAVFCGYTVEYYVRRDFVQQRLLAAERARSDRLLHELLPESVADRLRAGSGRIADRVPEVTALFADLRGFTPMTMRMEPEAMVDLLNRLYAAFDALAQQHRVEKITTAGDCFIAVGGVPAWRPDHADAVADLALDMQAAVARLNDELGLDLQVRIGIHTGGPVVAGVIGTTRYIYTIIGDAMNTASRMESHGVAGAIQVSGAAGERLRGRYALEERGEIDVKGKGLMRAYLLSGRIP
jgi:class 3 adenylate cyclase